MQHIYSFVSHVICLLSFPRFGAPALLASALFSALPQTRCCYGLSRLRPPSLPSCLPVFSVLSPFLWVIVSALSPFCFLLSPVSLFVSHYVRLVSFLSPFVSGLVSLLVRHCVRLVVLLFPFVSLLVSLLVDHCVSLVSLLFPFCLPSCLPSCWSLCPSCVSSVSFSLPSCPPCSWSLCASCLPSVSFSLPSCPPCCWSLCLVSLLFPFVSLLVSLLVGHCVRLVFPFVSLLASLLVEVSKCGLGTASLLFHLFGVYGGVL